MGREEPDPFSEAVLKKRLIEGDLAPIQVQLAAALKHGPSAAIGLPELRLEPESGTQRKHPCLPEDVERVLEGAKRDPHNALPEKLSVLWAADCADRAVHHVDGVLGPDNGSRAALSAVRGWIAGTATREDCVKAGHQANQDNVRMFGLESVPPLPARENLGPAIEIGTPAEAATYAAREAAVTVARPWDDTKLPRWALADIAAVHAGYAAESAAIASLDRENENMWQRNRLIALILTSSAIEWPLRPLTIPPGKIVREGDSGDRKTIGAGVLQEIHFPEFTPSRLYGEHTVTNYDGARLEMRVRHTRLLAIIAAGGGCYGIAGAFTGHNNWIVWLASGAFLLLAVLTDSAIVLSLGEQPTIEAQSLFGTRKLLFRKGEIREVILRFERADKESYIRLEVSYGKQDGSAGTWNPGIIAEASFARGASLAELGLRAARAFGVPVVLVNPDCAAKDSHPKLRAMLPPPIIPAA